MVRKWASYLLILLIAMQSVAAIADTHLLHQEGSEHLTFEHPHDDYTQTQQATEHDINAINQQLELLTNNSSPYDCHHCCHCHGSTQFFIDDGNNDFLTILINNSSTALNVSYISNLLSPALRPPIA